MWLRGVTRTDHVDPSLLFQTGPMNGRTAQEAAVHRRDCERVVAALPYQPRYGRNLSKSGRRRYGQMRKVASIRDQSDRTDLAMHFVG